MRIISSNDFDTASLASSPACAAATPITNMQVALRGSIARIVPVAAWTISGVLSPTGKTLSAMSLCRHNLTGFATVRLRLYSDAGMTTGIYDSTALAIGSPDTWGNFSWGVDPWQDNGFAGWPSFYYTLWFTAVNNVAAFKIDISDAGNTDGYLEIGRCYLGKYWSPLYNSSSEFKMTWKELTKQTRMGSMSLRSEGYRPYRAFSFDLAAWVEADRADFMALARVMGLRKDFFISFFPGAGGSREQDHAAACKFVASPGASTPFYNLWDSTAELEEI